MQNLVQNFLGINIGKISYEKFYDKFFFRPQIIFFQKIKVKLFFRNAHQAYERGFLRLK